MPHLKAGPLPLAIHHDVANLGAENPSKGTWSIGKIVEFFVKQKQDWNQLEIVLGGSSHLVSGL